METPSSTKRVTRSQTLLALSSSNIPISRKIEDSEKGVSKSRRRNGNQQQQQDRSALIDITNDSPIVGLAVGSLETPSSAIAKQRSNRFKNNINTPGSGEALLRGQVKTLLQKVEEEADLSKISLQNRPFLHLQGLVSSPMGLLAPTPANTPLVPNLNEDGSININDWASFTPLPVIEEQLKICQVVSEIFEGKKKQESLETQKSLTRSLLLDFSEKSEVTDASSECSSAITSSDSNGKSSSSSPLIDDDSASNWSIQVNASIHDQDEEEQLIEGEEEEEEDCYYHPDDYEEEAVYDYDDEELVAELCEGIGKISVNESDSKCRGKHTRFVYNSDDEIVEEEEVLHLKGLPTPTGKHLRFPMEEEEENRNDGF
ncbi:uncharacterized protein LOC8268716 isoform X2 [Ricinus communis]|uniref:Uncharacterized protein n=1 Tax=Ricinus communis TaxID=3988 RepID=B9S6P2_RICCO|nr:uncharacterized protein LOC8268716 isoform X2 [Ricinus communis]EEF40648.1 conserved hypothetical protein [Ricinus communis]|eukprot:XP_002521661.1 uncharacterized protein LOC8268716 isoform X2 [Ricinus communis]